MPFEKRYPPDGRCGKINLARLARDPEERKRVAAALGKKSSRISDITPDDLLRLAAAAEARALRRHYRLMHLVYGILRSEKWQVRYVRLYGNLSASRKLGLDVNDAIGTVDVDKKIIYVDFRYEVIATVVHECLHVLLDERFSGKRAHEEEEAKVQRLERLIMKRVSRVQATRLHRLINERLAI